jgi:hypothetical protein
LPRQVLWPRIFAEATAIVVSILLAFGIQAWWEGRQMRAVEAEILAGLESDFRANREQLDLIMGMLEAFQIPLADLDDLASGQLASISGTGLDIERALQGTPTFDSRDATLDAAISSGNLGAIRDSRLRELLAEWKGQVEDVGEEARDFREASARAMDRIGALGGPWVRDPSNHTLATGPASVAALARFDSINVRLVASDPELLARLRVKRIRALAYLRFLTPLVDIADSVLVRIESARVGAPG